MEDIMRKLEKALKSAVGEEYEVCFSDTRKNNGVILKSVSICRYGKNAIPKIHINEILEMIASEKMGVIEAADLIIKDCKKYEHEADNFEWILHGIGREKIFGCITGQIVNKSANAAMLMEVPYRTVLDLALIYRVVLLETEYGTNTFLVNNALCDHYSISLEELDNAAAVNMIREGFTAQTMETVLSEMDVMPDQSFAGECPMLIITNNRRLYGATVMTYPNYFSTVSEKIGSDIYILPSSIHEVIIVPVEGIDPGGLQQMVVEINASELNAEEFLSDNVYRYSRKTGEITIV